MTADRRSANAGSSNPIADFVSDPSAYAASSGPDFEDPASPAIHHWLNSMQKALKGLRVYAENNEMFRRFVQTAVEDMHRVHTFAHEVVLTVREDRLYFGRDPVHINPDREEGIPYVLYRNGFRRLTFVQGFDAAEMIAFLKAITTDFASVDHAGEDLCTVLWRLSLPHLRYFTLDTLAFTKVGGSVQEQQREVEEVARLQGEIDDLVAQIYSAHNADVSDEELVAGVSINREDLEALEQIQLESEEDLAILDQATERAIAHVSEEERSALARRVAEETNDDLVSRLIDILVNVLYREESAQDSAPTIELLQQLFESLILGFRFKHAHRLVTKIRAAAEDSADLKTLHVSRLLLRVFASKPRIEQIVGALNETNQGTNATEIVDFLRSLGPGASTFIVGTLDNVTAPAHRRLLCDLIAEGPVPPGPVLHEAMRNTKWFVAVDLLGLVQKHDWKQQALVLGDAVRHEHPKVRARSVQLLRGFPRGKADELIAQACKDPESDVRLTAYRVGAQRGSEKVREAVGQILRSEDFWELDPRELKTMMAAYAALAGSAAVPLLEQILNPGFFARSKMTEGQVAAASALAMIGSAEANEALTKGSRTLNTKVRDVCNRALDRENPEGRERLPAKDVLPNEPDPFESLGAATLPSTIPEAPTLASTINARPKLSGMAEVRTPHRESEVVPDRVGNAPIIERRISEQPVEAPKIRPTLKRRVSSVAPTRPLPSQAAPSPMVVPPPPPGRPVPPPPGTRPAAPVGFAPAAPPPPPTPPGGWPGSETPTFVGPVPGAAPAWPGAAPPPGGITPPPAAPFAAPAGWPSAEPITQVGPVPGYAPTAPHPQGPPQPGPSPQYPPPAPGYGPHPGYVPPPSYSTPQGYPLPPGGYPPAPAGYAPAPGPGYPGPHPGYAQMPPGYQTPPYGGPGYPPPPPGYGQPPPGYAPPLGYAMPPGGYGPPVPGPWGGPDARSYLPPLTQETTPHGDPFAGQFTPNQTPWSRHIPGAATPAPTHTPYSQLQAPPAPLPPLPPELGPNWADAVGSRPEFSLADDLTVDAETTEQEYPAPAWLPPAWPGSSGPKGGGTK